MAVSVERVGDSGSQAGKVGAVNIVKVNSGHFITPVSTSSGRLKLISWGLDDDGGFTRLGDSGNQAGKIVRCSSVAVANNRLVTAVQTASSDRLKLISWQVSADGTGIQRAEDSGNLAGGIDRVDLHRFKASDTTQMPIELITTVRTTSAKRLKLIGWRLFGNGDFSRIGDSGTQAGAVTQVAGHPGDAFDFFGTAVRATGAKDLKMIGWNVEESAGQLAFDRIGDSGAQAGDVKRVDLGMINMHVFPPGHPTTTFISPVRTSSNRLKLIAWRTDQENGKFERSGDSGTQAGNVDELWATASPAIGVVTAVRVANGDGLKVIWWGVTGNHVEAEGGVVEFDRLADSGNQAGAIRSVAGLLADNNNAFATVVTAVKTKSSGNLKLINWHLNKS